MVNTVSANNVTLNAINDTNGANVAMEFRAESFNFTTGVGGFAGGDIPLCLSTGSQMHTAAVTCGVSAKRFKENINAWGHGIDYLMKFRPVTFQLKKEYDAEQKQTLGFIADELGDIDPLLGVYDNGVISNFRERAVAAIMVKAIQEQQAQIEDLKGRVAVLNARF